MPTIEIDGQSLEVEPGEMIIQAADRAGIFIPRFCYHEKLSIAANCRMCLVEVEKAPKPLPACATPVADGMKVLTDSALAVEAQKGNMEFLLINHPLDCPVCDQGGECPLQDQAMGYGKDVSRFTEKKRVVEDKDIGPLIETEMTRCIHCTRCVRFGQEVAGIMELGMIGRGEHAEITTFLSNSVDSEVSGNMIDLCPVGALTNKPYRFTARAWELISHDAISPHDCVGTNINIQSIRGEVKRILPRTNESINECWLADRDRYSYQALNSPARLTTPMMRVKGEWQETDWETALKYGVSAMSRAIQMHGADQIGALVSPASTLEEFYLIQKLMRGLGSNNVDHRLKQRDFREDDQELERPWLGCNIADIDKAKAILLVGSNIRKEQPLLGLRVRRAALKGAKIMAINTMDYDFHFDLAYQQVTPPSGLPHCLAAVVSAALAKAKVPQEITAWAKSADGDDLRAMAETLLEAGDEGIILLGNTANNHDQASVIRALAQNLARRTGCAWGSVSDANAAAAWAAHCLPHRSPATDDDSRPGRNALEMVKQPLKGYLLLGVEPVLDCVDGYAATTSLEEAECVVALSAFDIREHTRADYLLPITPFSETPGTYINCEGLAQTVTAAVAPQGQARPAWKVLRVLGNLFNVDGFDYISSNEIVAAVNWERPKDFDDGTKLKVWAPNGRATKRAEVERIDDVPLYRTDGLVRRAGALQETADNVQAAVRLGVEQAGRLDVNEGDQVTVQANGQQVQLKVNIDERVPDGCVYIPSGYVQTARLGTSPTLRVIKE